MAALFLHFLYAMAVISHLRASFSNPGQTWGLFLDVTASRIRLFELGVVYYL